MSACWVPSRPLGPSVHPPWRELELILLEQVHPGYGPPIARTDRFRIGLRCGYSSPYVPKDVPVNAVTSSANPRVTGRCLACRCRSRLAGSGHRARVKASSCYWRSAAALRDRQNYHRNCRFPASDAFGFPTGYPALSRFLRQRTSKIHLGYRQHTAMSYFASAGLPSPHVRLRSSCHPVRTPKALSAKGFLLGYWVVDVSASVKLRNNSACAASY